MSPRLPRMAQGSSILPSMPLWPVAEVLGQLRRVGENQFPGIIPSRQVATRGRGEMLPGRDQQCVDGGCVEFREVCKGNPRCQDFAVDIQGDAARSLSERLECGRLQAGVDQHEICIGEAPRIIHRPRRLAAADLGQIGRRPAGHVGRPCGRGQLLTQRSHAAAQFPDRPGKCQGIKVSPLGRGTIEQY